MDTEWAQTVHGSKTEKQRYKDKHAHSPVKDSGEELTPLCYFYSLFEKGYCFFEKNDALSLCGKSHKGERIWKHRQECCILYDSSIYNRYCSFHLAKIHHFRKCIIWSRQRVTRGYAEAAFLQSVGLKSHRHYININT